MAAARLRESNRVPDPGLSRQISRRPLTGAFSHFGAAASLARRMLSNTLPHLPAPAVGTASLDVY